MSDRVCGKCMQQAAIKAGTLKLRKESEPIRNHYPGCPLKRKERK